MFCCCFLFWFLFCFVFGNPQKSRPIFFFLFLYSFGECDSMTSGRRLFLCIVYTQCNNHLRPGHNLTAGFRFRSSLIMRIKSQHYDFDLNLNGFVQPLSLRIHYQLSITVDLYDNLIKHHSHFPRFS